MKVVKEASRITVDYEKKPLSITEALLVWLELKKHLDIKENKEIEKAYQEYLRVKKL